MSTVDDVRERLRVDHRHPPETAAVVLGMAVLLAWYASWLTADLGLGTVSFALVAAVGAYGLYRQPDRRTVLVVGLYAFAGLIASTPVFLNLPFLLAAGAYGVANPTAFTMRLSDLVFVVVFLVVAAVPALTGWWLSGR